MKERAMSNPINQETRLEFEKRLFVLSLFWLVTKLLLFMSFWKKIDLTLLTVQK